MRTSRFLFTGVSSLAIALAVSSCRVADLPHIPAPQRQPVLYEWFDDDESTTPVTITISLEDQVAEIKRGDRDIGWCYVATGKEGHGTKAGTYKITEKIADKHSNLYGWFEDENGNVTNGDASSRDKVPPGMVYKPAPMPYWMRLTSYGIGMHGGLIPDPGKPASHGCIRMPKEFVPDLFDLVKVGTPVVITQRRSGRPLPEHETHPPMRNWDGSSGALGGVQSVRYYQGQPVSFN